MHAPPLVPCHPLAIAIVVMFLEPEPVPEDVVVAIRLDRRVHVVHVNVGHLIKVSGISLWVIGIGKYAVITFITISVDDVPLLGRKVARRASCRAPYPASCYVQPSSWKVTLLGADPRHQSFPQPG